MPLLNSVAHGSVQFWISFAVLGDLCGPADVQTCHFGLPFTIHFNIYHRVSQEVCDTLYSFYLYFIWLKMYKSTIFRNWFHPELYTKTFMRNIRWWRWWDNKHSTSPKLYWTWCTHRPSVGKMYIRFLSVRICADFQLTWFVQIIAPSGRMRPQ